MVTLNACFQTAHISMLPTILCKWQQAWLVITRRNLLNQWWTKKLEVLHPLLSTQPTHWSNRDTATRGEEQDSPRAIVKSTSSSNQLLQTDETHWSWTEKLGREFSCRSLQATSREARVQQSTPKQGHTVKLLSGSKTLMQAKFMKN